MGKRRIRNLQFLGYPELRGVDPREDRRSEVRERYGVSSFERFDEGLEWEPDAVIVSTPPDRHAPFALAALDAGRHFFVEASVVSDGLEEISKRLQESSVIGVPSCTMRFNPAIRLIKSILDRGEIGNVAAFIYHMGQYLPDWHPWEDYREFYVSQPEVGAAREMVCFELVWLSWMFGEPTYIRGLFDKLSGLDVPIDDVYQLQFRFPGGVLGGALIDVVSRIPYRTLRLVSEDGVIEWSAREHMLRLYRAPEEEWRDIVEPEQTFEPGYVVGEDMYRDEVRCFIEAIEGKTVFPHDFAADLRIHTLLQEVEASDPDAAGRHG